MHAIILEKSYIEPLERWRKRFIASEPHAVFHNFFFFFSSQTCSPNINLPSNLIKERAVTLFVYHHLHQAECRSNRQRFLTRIWLCVSLPKSLRALARFTRRDVPKSKSSSEQGYLFFFFYFCTADIGIVKEWFFVKIVLCNQYFEIFGKKYWRCKNWKKEKKFLATSFRVIAIFYFISFYDQ